MKNKVRINVITNYDDEIKDSYVVEEGETIRVTKTFLITAKEVWKCNSKNIQINTVDNINIQINQSEEK